MVPDHHCFKFKIQTDNWHLQLQSETNYSSFLNFVLQNIINNHWKEVELIEKTRTAQLHQPGFWPRLKEKTPFLKTAQ